MVEGPKKILLVANVAKDHVLKFHVPTIRELKRRGWTVDVACAGEEEIPECDRQFIMKWRRSPISTVTLKEILQLRKIIHNGDYDVVYCHTPMGGLASRIGSIGTRRHGAKVIYCAHGFHFFTGAPLFYWMVYYPAEKILSHMTDMIITINFEDYERVKNRFRKGLKLRLIPGIGANLSRIEIDNKDEMQRRYRSDYDIPDDATVMIYVSELTHNKNQSMLIDSLADLRVRGINAYLMLVGPDYTKKYYEKYAQMRNVKEYCRFLGWREDVGELLATADVYVASSIREGMTINIIEAIHAGLPIIATDNRGHRMAMEDCTNGSIVAINDVKAMADKIAELVNSEKSRTYKEDPLFAEKYDADRIAACVADIIEEEVS